MKRFNKIIDIVKHKKALFDYWKKNKIVRKDVSLFRVLMHDTEKIFTTLILGKEIAKKIHGKINSHHTFSSDVGIREAVLDWEVARFTKPKKQMNARETCLKYYPFLLDKVIPICDKWKI